ncbi:putative transposable element [Trichonephila clavipes]|nr:putative transposable element [Trichonephila clavipes]
MVCDRALLQALAENTEFFHEKKGVVPYKDLLTINGTKHSTFQDYATVAGLSKSKDFTNEVLGDVASRMNAGGIIGPYFFKNDEGHNVTVNGDRYRAMITNFFIPELNNHDVQELWFQQDGAICHTARATNALLKDTFGDRLISRFGPVNWPPRSCDLTPLDYFLWGYVKSLIYADTPQTLDHLEDNIRRVIADIRPQMLEKVIENWTSRLDYIRASRGSSMPEIIFKM